MSKNASVKVEWDEATEKKIENKFKEWTKGCGGKNNNYSGNASGGAVYGFGLIGALIYYLGSAGSFSDVVMGILKSIVWPAMFVYHIFQSLGL